MNDLSSAIKQQLDNLNQLKDLLESELHLISGRDAEALLSLVKQKEQLLDTIAKSDDHIAQLYANATDNGSLNDEDQSLIEDAKSLLEQCKFRTDINAKAVEQGQLKLEHLRNTLIEIRAKESLTYDKSGKPSSGNLGKGVSA